MSNKWDVNYMRRIAGLPLLEWEDDPAEAQAQRIEATESGIGYFLKRLNVAGPFSEIDAQKIADRIEDMSSEAGYGSTISAEDVMNYLEVRHLIA